MTYPRPAGPQSRLIKEFRARTEAVGKSDKPAMEPLYLDLAADPDTPPRPIHLGLHVGTNPLREYLKTREEIGVNHIALNLRFNRADTESTLRKLAGEIISEFTQ